MKLLKFGCAILALAVGPVAVVGQVTPSEHASLRTGATRNEKTLAPETVGTTEVTPNVLVFATKTGNVVASVGPDGALLIGTPSADSTEPISSELAKRTKSPVRYVVIMPGDPAHSEGDAGWGRRGGFVAMLENALQRIGGHVMGAPKPLSERFVKLGVDIPRVSFSEVISFDLNGEAVHIVKQRPGYSDADALVHFHIAKLVYWGEAFPGDGYPAIDAAQKGTLDGLLRMLEGWTDPGFRVVPARGEVTNGASVKAFRDMIVTVRDRVKHSIDAGRTESEVVAEHPTAEFDTKWGHGRVAPDVFVQEIYRALRRKSEAGSVGPATGAGRRMASGPCGTSLQAKGG
jgi:cyclase